MKKSVAEELEDIIDTPDGATEILSITADEQSLGCHINTNNKKLITLGLLMLLMSIQEDESLLECFENASKIMRNLPSDAKMGRVEVNADSIN